MSGSFFRRDDGWIYNGYSRNWSAPNPKPSIKTTLSYAEPPNYTASDRLAVAVVDRVIESGITQAARKFV